MTPYDASAHDQIRDLKDRLDSQSERIQMLSERVDSHRKSITDLKARLQVEEGRGAWAHPDLTYRQEVFSDRLDKLERRLTADEESTVAVQGDLNEALAKLYRALHEDQPEPWSWQNDRGMVFKEKLGGVHVEVRATAPDCSPEGFEAMCRSYLRTRGVDV